MHTVVTRRHRGAVDASHDSNASSWRAAWAPSPPVMTRVSMATPAPGRPVLTRANPLGARTGSASRDARVTR